MPFITLCWLQGQSWKKSWWEGGVKRVGLLYCETLFRKSWIYAITLESSLAASAELKMHVPRYPAFPSSEELSHMCVKRHAQG